MYPSTSVANCIAFSSTDSGFTSGTQSGKDYQTWTTGANHMFEAQGATVTSINASRSSLTCYLPLTGAGNDDWQQAFFFEIEKTAYNGSNQATELTARLGHPLGTAAQQVVDVSQADVLAALAIDPWDISSMEPTGANFGESTKSSIAFDEASDGELDTVWFGWNKTGPVMYINYVAIAKFDT